MAAFSFLFSLLSIFFLSLAFWCSVASASTSTSTSTSTPTSSRIRIPSPFVENPLTPQYFTSTSSSIPTEQQLHPTISERCRTSLIAWKNITYPQQITMQLYSGHSFDDLGLFDACQLLPVAHHCTVTFPIAGIQSSMGLCIPKSCTQQDILLELPTLMGLPLGLIYDGLLISGVAGNETIVACADQQTRWYEDKGATGMVVLVIILASMVAITTVADHMLMVREFSVKQAHMRESHNYPSNAIYVALPNFVSVTNGATIQQEATSSHHTQTEHVPIWHRFIQSFSAIRSIRSLLAPSPVSGIDMSCLNGIRVLSIMWIILAHTMFFHAELFRDPIYLLTSVVNRVSIQVVLEAFFAVDSFFFLTGFLSAYLLLQQLSHTHSKLSHLLIGYYIHRYLRLTLIYFFWLCMYWKLSRYIGAGQSPTQYELQGYVSLNKQGELVQFTKEESCDKYWWTNLLYINNFYPSHYADVCMNWSWYMANEMQFAILLPFLVLLYHRSRIAGLTLLIALLTTSFTYVGIISHQHGFTTNMLHQQFNLDPQMNHDYQNLLYNKPWARMQPWLIGILYAYLLHARPQRISPPRIYWSCMAVAAFLMIGLVFGPAQLYQDGGNDNWSRTTHDLYMATSRGMWAVGLGYLCYSMIVGTGEEPLIDVSDAKETKPGSYVTSFLSHPIWTPLARLSYQAYLVHSTWIIIFIHQYRSKPYYTDLMYVYWIIGNIIMAFVLAAVGYVLVEKPLTNLTNWAMRGKGETHSADHHH